MDGVSDQRPDVSWPRRILLLVLAWWTLRLALDSGWIFLDYVNLAFHEAGHVFFSFAGSTVHFLGGTLGQLLVPTILVVYFLRYQRQPTGAAFCLWWIGQNLINISVYMADARELALPLVGGGEHDWNELFFRWGLLAEPSVERVSGLTHLLGVAIMVCGLVWWVYFVLPRTTRRNVQYRLTDRWPWLDPALDS